MCSASANADYPESAKMEEEEMIRSLRMQATTELRCLLESIRRPGHAREFPLFDNADDVPPRIRLRCDAQFDFLEGFKENWRPLSSSSFGLPKNWLEPEIGHMTRPSRGDFVAAQVVTALEPLEGHFHALSDAELVQNCTDSQSWRPDFLLASPPRYVRPYASDLPDTAETFFRPNARRSASTFLQIMQSYGGEGELLDVVVNALRNIPGSFPIGSPVLDFPPVMESEAADKVDFENIQSAPCTDFAFVLNFFGSERLLSQVDTLPISLAHPALLLGIESSSPLIDEPKPNAPASSRLAEHRKKLSQAANSSLDTHILNWLLTHPDKPLDSIPPWLMIFGLICDDAALQIVAHFPYLDSDAQNGVRVWGYVSYLLDEIPFESVSLSVLDRMRLAMALFSLQRHTFRLSALWEPFADCWPLVIQRVEVVRDELYIRETQSDVEAFDEGVTGAFNDNKCEELLQAERFIATHNLEAQGAGDSGDLASIAFLAASRGFTHIQAAATVQDWLRSHPEKWEGLEGQAF